MVTLRDLAAACGCSVTSASRALKNSRSISKKLRERVHRAAMELGYIPNNIAGSMRTGMTNTIAVIMQDAMNPYYSIITTTVERRAAERGYNIIIITTGYKPERELNAVYEALRKKVDGVLLFPIQQDTNAVEALIRAETPFVLVGRAFDDVLTDCVMPDDRQGAYLVTRHMLESGRRRLMMINSFRFISSSRLREAGFRQAMAEFGLGVRDSDVHYIATDKGHCARLVQKVFSKKRDYDGICCYCDVLAYEAYYQLKLMGLKVPDDVALTGVDDLHSYLTFPVPVTSAGYDIEGVARGSFDLLLEKIEHDRNGGAEKAPWQRRIVILNQHLAKGETT